MLDCSARNLYMEIEAAERYRDQHTAVLRALVNQYTGQSYDQNPASEGKQDQENHVYETLALTVPRIVLENPKVRCKSRRGGPRREVAKAMMHAQNRWIRDVTLRDLLIRVAGDYLLGWGVTMTAQGPVPGFDPRSPASRQRPHVYRLSPHRFFMDPWALTFGHSRFVGHKWVRDKDDLLADDRFNKDAVESLSSDLGTDDLEERKATNDIPSRNEIVGYEVWVPEKYVDGFGPEDGFHGTIYTLAVATATDSDDTSVEFIREPRPYYGPRWGPYSMFGVYGVPDRVYPLSPLVATNEQSDELNRHVRSASKAMEKYKRIVLYDAGNPDLGKKLRETPSDWVVPVEGLLKDHVEVIEIGGLTQQHDTYITMLRERLDRVSGLHELQRGNLHAPGSATAAHIADTAYSVRLAFIRNQFASATRQVLETAGWYMYHDDRVMFPLGEDAADELGMVDPWFYGGEHDENMGATYDDLELEIEPYSMERTDEQMLQRRWFEGASMIMQMAPMMPQMPWVEWRPLMERGGDVLNDPDFAGLINFELLEQLSGVPMGPPADVAGPVMARFSAFPTKIGGGMQLPGGPFPTLEGNQTGAQHSAAQKPASFAAG